MDWCANFPTFASSNSENSTFLRIVKEASYLRGIKWLALEVVYSRDVPALGYSIRFDQKIVGTTLDRAFGVIEGWLKTNGGKIKEELRPQFVVASHGRSLQPMGWRKDAKKTMRFELLQQGSDVLVIVNISPSGLNASDVKSREEDARANWNQLLADLWGRFGEMGQPNCP